MLKHMLAALQVTVLYSPFSGFTMRAKNRLQVSAQKLQFSTGNGGLASKAGAAFRSQNESYSLRLGIAFAVSAKEAQKEAPAEAGSTSMLQFDV